MTLEEAIDLVCDIAATWEENAEEILPQRISPEMVTNDALWDQVRSEITDENDLEIADECRAVCLAIEVIRQDRKARGIIT